jgi:pimeloyl-ACP methyl ester carboxylesterase
MKWTFFSLLALAAFVYFCFCLYLYLFQRSFIYFPTPAIDRAPAEELWLDIDNERIRIWRLHAAEPDAILYFGGNAEDVSLNIQEFSEWFPEQAVYLANYRGYGGSTGSPGETALFNDAEATFDFVKGRHPNVSVIGRSLGAAVAVDLAAGRDVARLALVTPFDSLARLARDFYPIFPTSVLLKDKYDSLGRAGRIRAPVLIIVAEQDEIIPRESSERLAGAIAESLVTLIVMEGTSHNTVGISPAYGRTLQAFMTDTVSVGGQ